MNKITFKNHFCQWTQKDVDNILKHYPGKTFVMEVAFPINALSKTVSSELLWSDNTCLLFWEKDKGIYDSHYMAVYMRGNKVYVASGQTVVDAINSGTLLGYYVNDSEVLYSACRHDFNSSSDGRLFVDGGFSYIRTNIASGPQYRLEIKDGVATWIKTKEEKQEPVEEESSSWVIPEYDEDDDTEWHFYYVSGTKMNDYFQINDKRITFSSLELIKEHVGDIISISYLGRFTEHEFFSSKAETF